MIKFLLSLVVVICASVVFYNLGFSNAGLFEQTCPTELLQTADSVPFYGYYDNLNEDILIKSKDLDIYQTHYVMMHEGFHKFFDDKYVVDLVNTDPRNEYLAERVLDGFHCSYDGNEPDIAEYWHEICDMGVYYE